MGKHSLCRTSLKNEIRLSEERSLETCAGSKFLRVFSLGTDDLGSFYALLAW